MGGGCGSSLDRDMVTAEGKQTAAKAGWTRPCASVSSRDMETDYDVPKTATYPARLSLRSLHSVAPAQGAAPVRLPAPQPRSIFRALDRAEGAADRRQAPGRRGVSEH